MMGGMREYDWPCKAPYSTVKGRRGRKKGSSVKTARRTFDATKSILTDADDLSFSSRELHSSQPPLHHLRYLLSQRDPETPSSQRRLNFPRRSTSTSFAPPPFDRLAHSEVDVRSQSRSSDVIRTHSSDISRERSVVIDERRPRERVLRLRRSQAWSSKRERWVEIRSSSW